MGRPRAKPLRPVLPNAGLAIRYRRLLERWIDEMIRSTRAALRDAERPQLAHDAPFGALRATLVALKRRWIGQFDEAAPRLADWFARDAFDRSDRSLASILKRGGFSVKLQETPTMRNVLEATVEANVALIKSIPEQYLGKVEGMVMRSVQAGRDLATLTGEIEALGVVTRKRAELIARDQNNKATAALRDARQIELGIEQAVWMHSHAGREPRPTHVAMHGEVYEIAVGIYDEAEGRHVKPGELINCRCTSRPIIPGIGR